MQNIAHMKLLINPREATQKCLFKQSKPPYFWMHTDFRYLKSFPIETSLVSHYSNRVQFFQSFFYKITQEKSAQQFSFVLQTPPDQLINTNMYDTRVRPKKRLCIL